MKLARRNTHGLFPSFDVLFNDFFNEGFATVDRPVAYARPAVNIKETEGAFELEVVLPGVNKDNVEVKVERNLLTVASKKAEDTGETAENGTYTRREFRAAAFQRAFTMPKSVDGEAISANFADGILTLTLPKKEEAKEKPARVIEIA